MSKAHAAERVSAREEEAGGSLRKALDAGPYLVLRLDAFGAIREACSQARREDRIYLAARPTAWPATPTVSSRARRW